MPQYLKNKKTTLAMPEKGSYAVPYEKKGRVLPRENSCVNSKANLARVKKEKTGISLFG